LGLNDIQIAVVCLIKRSFVLSLVFGVTSVQRLRFIAYILRLCLVWAFVASPGLLSVNAQPLPEPSVETGRSIVSRVRFRGNNVFTADQLEARVRTKANRRFLRIPGFTWWLWLHQLGESNALGRRVGRALIATGEPPAYLDTTVVQQDIERLINSYRQEGYREANVQAHVDTLANGRLEVLFLVDQGRPTYIGTVRYDSENLDQQQREALARQSLLKPTAIRFNGDTLSFLPDRQLFTVPALHEERRRILTFLRDQGYASATRDSIRAIVFPKAEDTLDVAFVIRPGERFLFDDVLFAVSGPEQAASLRIDTLVITPSDSAGIVVSQIEGDRRLRNSLLRRSLQFAPGEWYNQSLMLATKRRLEGTGVFAYTRIEALMSDTTHTPGIAGARLPHRIELRTRERHQMRFETFMLQRNGVLSTSDNELGTGVGVTYENANVLGRGELLRLNTTGSIAGDVDSTLFTSAQVEVSASLTTPYLIRPFHRLEDLFDLYDARSQLSIAFLTARREQLRLVIRGRGSARFRVEMQHSPTFYTFLDAFDLTLSNPDTLVGFKENFLDQIVDAIDDPVQRAQIEEDYTKPQINNALRYSFRSANANPLRRDQGYSYEGSFEIGGNLPYFIDRYIATPDSLEGRLPGLGIFKSSSTDNSLIYRQYIRMGADFRRYNPMNARSIIAWKVVSGFAHPTGDADVVPFDRRFYSGGAASVRGWGLRELGPGRSQLDSSSPILGGEIKLEASLEVRNTIMYDVLAADWILAFFGDTGNVWIGPRNPGGSVGRFRFNSFYRELGLGTGLGLRLAWEYLIVRLDLAYKVHDPARGGGFFDHAFSDSRLHFGIGHAF
jgi:outer membrane protein insertion porin family